MESLQEIAIATFQKNLLYFEKEQKDIYNKLAALDSAVEQGHYQNKYDLVVQDNYLDVLEFSTNNYLYSSSSIDYASLAAKSINYKKDSNVFESFRKFNIKQSVLLECESQDITQNAINGVAHIIDYIDKNSSDNVELQNIYKFIFFGVGIGTHIATIDKKIKAKVYLIIEDDLELFRLSLFATPYFDLAKNAKLIFSVFDSPAEFTQIAQKFIDTEFYYNHYIKYFEMLSHSEEKLEKFHVKLASQSHNLFFYSEILNQYVKPLEYLNNNFNFLNLINSRSKTSLTNKPVILLAAGPSLQNNIEWIKKNQDKFLIVALSATLNTLEAEGIKPDIVTHIDGFDRNVIHFEKLNSLDFLQDTIFLISARTPKGIVRLLNKEHIFFFENGTSYKNNFGNLSAFCVGSTTYLILLALDVRELYLLGLDLALDSKTGSTHSGNHEYAKKLNLESSDEEKDTITFKDTVLKTHGNFEETVYTTPDFMLSIESINSSSSGLKQDNQNVYNLSNGAKLKNTITKSINSIEISSFESLDKKLLDTDILNSFLSFSTHKLSKAEKKFIEEKVTHSLKLKDIIIKQEKSSFSSSTVFLESLSELLKDLTKSSSNIDYDIALIYQEYFKYIYTFIFDYFNNKSIINTKADCSTLNTLLCTQLLRIIDHYLNKLQK